MAAAADHKDAKVRSAYDRRQSQEFKLAAQQLSATRPTSEVAILLNKSDGWVKYHKRKGLDPDFHSGAWGGPRRSKFSSEQSVILELFCWSYVTQRPTVTQDQLARIVNTNFVPLNYPAVGRRWIGKCVKRWGFSYKKIEHVQIHKFTTDNMLYYTQWVFAVQDLPLLHLKFCDEGHYTSRALRPSRGLARRGDPLRLPNAQSLTEAYSLTILTQLSNFDSPVHVGNPRAGSNSAGDFLQWVRDCIQLGHLAQGDYLVVDNAAVHIAASIVPDLTAALNAAGVTMYLLPKYSPELNPCELVFAQTKRWIRSPNRDPASPLWEAIIGAFARVTWDHVLSYYTRCLGVADREIERAAAFAAVPADAAAAAMAIGAAAAVAGPPAADAPPAAELAAAAAAAAAAPAALLPAAAPAAPGVAADDSSESSDSDDLSSESDDE